MSYITHIETALPDYAYKRGEILHFFLQSVNDDSTKRKIKVVADKSGIETRYSVLRDFNGQPGDLSFFSTDGLGPTVTQRMQVFKTEALNLSLKAIRKIKNFETEKNKITHLITVTCTGLFAPGLDVELVSELGLSPGVARSGLNFMGCNAAIIALRQANDICKSNPGAKVLIVCTELCTIHFRKIDSDDYILSTSLFADGSAAAIVSAEAETPARALKVESFNTLLVPDGGQNMAWQLSESAFIMNLSSYVSQLINGKMPEVLQKMNLDKTTVELWAVHPGGKKILDDFAATLMLEINCLKESYEVLKNYGNMSSATVLFVLKELMNNHAKSAPGASVLSLAFGPGLSVEAMHAVYV